MASEATGNSMLRCQTENSALNVELMESNEVGSHAFNGPCISTPMVAQNVLKSDENQQGQTIAQNVKNYEEQFPWHIHRTAIRSFQIDTFLEQFLVHMLYPFSVPYLDKTYGPQAKSIQFLDVLFRGDAIDLFRYSSHCYWILAVLFCLFDGELTTAGISRTEFFVALAAGGVYRLIIASRYASLTAEEYVDFLKEQNQSVVAELRSQMQLLTGWMQMPLSACLHEAKLAMRRSGPIKGSDGSGNGICFSIKKDDIGAWSKLLGDEASALLHMSGTGPIDLDVSTFLGVIVYAAHPRAKSLQRLSIIMIAVSILFTLLPGLIRVSCLSLSKLVVDDIVNDDRHISCPSSSFFGDGAFANVFSAHVSFIMLLAAMPLNFFFCALILSNYRHLRTCQMFGQLIRVDTTYPSIEEFPIIDISTSVNLRAWIRARLALHHFGIRYRWRLDLYAKVSALMLLFLLAWVWVYAFDLQSKNSDADSEDFNSGGPNRLLIDVSWWYTITLLIFWGAFYFLTLCILAETNDELNRHEICFLQHRVTVRERKLHATKAAKPGKVNGKRTSKYYCLESGADPFMVFNGEDLAETIKEIDQKQNDLMEKRINEYQLQMAAQEEADELTRKEDELDELLDTAIGIIEAESRIQPARLVGAIVTWELVSSFAIAWLAVFGATVNLAGISYSSSR